MAFELKAHKDNYIVRGEVDMNTLVKGGNFISGNTNLDAFLERLRAHCRRAFGLVALGLLGGGMSHTFAAPGDITNDPFWTTGTNQVGNCGSSYNFGSCTANDFRITNLTLSNVVDACTSDTDYMQADLAVTFSKAQPIRYDVMAYFYRGEEAGTAFDLNPDAAVSGDWCTRVGIGNGLQIFNPGATGSFTGDIDGDQTAPGSGVAACFDVPNGNQNGTINQTEFAIVLPCRDGDSNGIVDISACTGWSQSADPANCSGPEYDGVTEPQNGTGSKCNCAAFDTDPVVTIPSVTVDKLCEGDDAAGNGTNSPNPDGSYSNGDVVQCTITISNAAGFGTLVGATSSTTEGFFYVDDYDETLGAISSISVVNSGGGSPTSSDGVPSAGMLSIYPDDILSGSNVTVTYLFTIDATYTEAVPEPDIVNTVCTNYYDPDTATTTTYTDVASGECATNTITTTPITLSDFSVRRSAIGGFDFEWVTATESNNLGFNIYGVAGQSLIKLNDQIIPSKAVSTMDQSVYSKWLSVAPGVPVNRFYLEDVDIEGNAKKHGPFKLSNKKLKIRAQKKTDWAGIKGKNRAAKKIEERRSGRQSPAAQKKAKNGEDADAPVYVHNITVSSSGLQRVPIAGLLANGVTIADLKQGRYQLTNSEGKQIPSQVILDRKRSSGYLEFIANTARTFYALESVYQFRALAQNGAALSMQRVRGGGVISGTFSSSYQHTEVLSDDLLYVNSSHIEGDPWMMSRLFAWGSTGSLEFDLPMLNAKHSDGPVHVSVEVAGGIDVPDEVDRSASLSVDSVELDQKEFDGTEAAVLSGALEVGANTDNLTIKLSTTPLNRYKVDILYPNSVSVTFPRSYVAVDNSLTFRSNDSAFSVSGFTDDMVKVFASNNDQVSFLGDLPVMNGLVEFAGVDGFDSYHVVGASAAQTPSVEAVESRNLLELSAPHLVIAHPSFVGGELDDYLDQRAIFAGGASAVVDTQSIYTQFSGGLRDASAIHDFLVAYSKVNELRSVLIVGGDVYDYHDNLQLGAVSFVPTLYRETGRLIKFSPVDSLYGDLDGDLVPDVPVGRIPARTLEELQVLLDKSLVFANLSGDQSAVLAADEKGASSVYDFKRASERVANLIEPKGWDLSRVYLDDLAIGEARSSLLDGLNQGPRFALYTGHSSPATWSGKGMFSYQDAIQLTNDERPSAYLQWGCYNTFFSSPTADSMSHGLMLAGSQGAAMVIGSSTLTSAHAEERFSVLVQEQLLAEDKSFGDAVVSAKQQYYQEEGLRYRGIMWGVSLLGDPLLSL